MVWRRQSLRALAGVSTRHDAVLQLRHLKTMPLLGRFLDPLLGVFTGVLAFQLRQNDVRYAPPEEERLSSLVRWKYNQWREHRAKQSEINDDEVWTAALKSVSESKSKH